MNKIAIVTSLHENYVSYLEGWLGSIKKFGYDRRCRICVLNAGLANNTIASLKSEGVDVIDVEWKFQFPSHVPKYFEAMACRPYICDYLENDYIFWVDVDAWFQVPGLDEIFNNAIKHHDVLCVPEIDRAYSPYRKKNYSQGIEFKSGTVPNAFNMRVESFFAVYQAHFGLEEAIYLSSGVHIVNAGVLFAHRNSPLWKQWQHRFESCVLSRGEEFMNSESLRPDKFVEQCALNAAIYLDKVKANFLPSTFNWLCNLGLPNFDKRRQLFTEGNWPFSPLNIIHMASRSKKGKFRLSVVDDQVALVDNYVEMSLSSPYQVSLIQNSKNQQWQTVD